jgi:hypothetical protein
MNLALIRILLVLVVFIIAFWGIYSYGDELRVPGIFLLIVLLRFYSSDTFRNWRLRRKLERISKNSIKNMKNNNQSAAVSTQEKADRFDTRIL